MIFIAAGSLEQATEHARLNGYGKDDWRYVHGYRTLQGVSGSLHICGTFWERRDAPEIYESALARGLCV